jgi:hypothetical protein
MATARKKLIASSLVSAAVDTRQAGINAAAIDAISAFFDKLSTVEKYGSRDEDGFPYMYETQAEDIVKLAEAACMYLPETMRPGVERALVVLEVIQAAQETGAWLDKTETTKDDDGTPRERVLPNYSVAALKRCCACGILIACGKWTKKEEA